MRGLLYVCLYIAVALFNILSTFYIRRESGLLFLALVRIHTNLSM